MKNTTAVLLLALGLAWPATAFGQTGDPAPRPVTRRGAPRKMVVAADQTSSPAAAGESPSSSGSRRRPVPPLIAAVDANHDGILDSSEIAKAVESLHKLDKNADGKITSEELRSSRTRSTSSANVEMPGSENGQRPSRSRLGALDANRDGVLDATEISSATQALLKLDKNSDGKVTLDELRTSRVRSPRTPQSNPGAKK